jgi:hypothetical protein
MVCPLADYMINLFGDVKYYVIIILNSRLLSKSTILFVPSITVFFEYYIWNCHMMRDNNLVLKWTTQYSCLRLTPGDRCCLCWNVEKTPAWQVIAQKHRDKHNWHYLRFELSWCDVMLVFSETPMLFIYKQQQIDILFACLAFLHSFVYETTLQRNLH